MVNILLTRPLYFLMCVWQQNQQCVSVSKTRLNQDKNTEHQGEGDKP